MKNPSRVAEPIERRLHKRRSLFAITPGMPVYRDHIRTAQPKDADAVSALSEASYSRLLAESYDSGVLYLALPHMIKADPKFACVRHLLSCGDQAGHACWMRRVDGGEAWRRSRERRRGSAYWALCRSPRMDTARVWNFLTHTLHWRCSIARNTQTSLLFDIERGAVLPRVRFRNDRAH